MTGEFKLRDWHVEPSKNRISRGGSAQALQPRLMNVLVHLARASHEVVSADELLDAHWPSRSAESSNLHRVITKLRSKLGDRANAKTGTEQYVETVPKRGYRIADSCPVVWTDGAANTSAEPTLAVLPFSDFNAPADQAYFGEGLAEELLNMLVQVPGLQVRARSSSFRFRDTSTGVAEIADALDVIYLLDGSVRRSGKRIRVTVQLIYCPTDDQLWSERFDEEVDDVLDVQERIAAAILGELDVHLNQGLKIQAPTDMRAHEYLLGAMRALDRKGFRSARELTEKSLTLDDRYCPAWVTLAETFATELFFGGDAPSLAPRLIEAVDRAAELDPSNYLIRLRRSEIRFFVARDFQGAVNDMHALMTRYPGDSRIYASYSFMLSTLAKYDEAGEVASRRIMQDPLNPLAHIDAATIALSSRQTSQAGPHLQRAAELGRRVPLLLAYVAAGEGDESTFHALLSEPEINWRPVSHYKDIIRIAWAHLHRNEPVEPLISEYKKTDAFHFPINHWQIHVIEENLDTAFAEFDQVLASANWNAMRDARGFSWEREAYRAFYDDTRFQQALEKHGLDDAALNRVNVPPLPFAEI